MKFIALKTKDGELKGDIAFFCRILHVSRQGFYQYLANKDRPWKYQPLADAMKEISYWNNRRICSANGGLPPIVKRQQYYDSLKEVA